jgi:hypothetical protein
MTTANYLDAEGLSRRDLLKRGLIGGGLVAAGLATPGLTGVAQAKGGKSIVLDVDTDGFADLDFTGSDGGATGAFYVSGEILAPGTSDHLGGFHCWGWIRPDNTGVVNQEFAIDGRGKILIAGVESDAPRAVTGGTGDFVNARGEGLPDVVIFDFANSGKFRIAFSLTGASGPPIG